ncbi:hypothetical protein TRFO_31795 [Tritrichomonas foetus]|uniref:Uncharacterized protein n=1 Tax=Tritrichomonas foetus TaxID=1144522 RepID=A0A1J4JVV4_9EUKA|nr:hypothetical protein TRFO_31795 [Tritrichomonas foetus]|eukprot:OHT01413.1 hypothetical protein TRFO_31795 [Tritrichomonas foetus]
MKGDKNGKWFSVITYPDTNGIIPVEANSELGRGFKYDVVANYDKVDFSKISVGAISVKTYSSSSSNNIKINVKKGSVVRQQHKSSKSSKSIRAENNQTSFYTNVCYSIDNNPIPVKRSAYLSDPINYAIQVGFDVKEAEFDPSNLEIDSNGCLTIYTYKLETPNKDKIMELTGIKDFVKGAEVSVSGEYDNIFTPPEEDDTNITLDSNSTDGSGSGSGSGGDGSNTDNEEPKSKAPLIAGVVVAVIVVIGVVVGILVYFLVIRKRRESSLSSNNTGNEDL